MLWDSGLELGHSVRTLPELRAALRRDTDLMTAVLDSRLISGEDALRDELHAMRDGICGRQSGELLRVKLEETRRRWKKYGWSYHLIEPNVKESPGGLRDHQMLRWVGIVLPWEGTLEGLYRLASSTGGRSADIQRAFDFSCAQARASLPHGDQLERPHARSPALGGERPRVRRRGGAPGRRAVHARLLTR